MTESWVVGRSTMMKVLIASLCLLAVANAQLFSVTTDDDGALWRSPDIPTLSVLSCLLGKMPWSAAPAAAPPAAAPASAPAPASNPGAPASILYKTPKEGERIPRSKGIYVEYHIENFVEGMWSKFFLRSAEIARPTTDRFGFEFPEAGPGFYTVRELHMAAVLSVRSAWGLFFMGNLRLKRFSMWSLECWCSWACAVVRAWCKASLPT
jgi:hypothetical protein